MFTFFLVCAAVGCVVMVLQFLLAMLGFAGDFVADIDMDVDVSDLGDISSDTPDVSAAHVASGVTLAKLFTLQTIVTFLAFFGLIGASVLRSGGTEVAAVTSATIAGFGAMYAIAWLMLKVRGLANSGTVDIQNSVGQAGRVYLRVPGEGSGAGKVTLEIQGRRMEFLARTKGTELPTGSAVVVTGVVDDRTLEVSQLAS